MSWLHKFFDLFLGESEEDAERETKPAQIPQQQEVHHPEGQLKRLEDPKIYYEYPKGKFRFPVVPDGYKNHDLRRRRTPSDEPKSAPRPSAAPYRERPRNEKEQHTYQAAEPAKKPFKPTNIPSPIYGFNQKPSVKKDVPKKPSETLNEPDKSVKEKVTLLSEEIERERGYPASDTQAHSKKESPFFPDTQFEKQPSGVLNRKDTENDEALAKRPAEPSGNKVPFESGVQQPEKEEPSFPAEHAEEQTPPEMLTDTAAEGLSDSEVGREEPATAKEEQREQQPEKIEEPVFSAELDEEQTAPESQTESVSEDEKAKEPSDSPVYNHHENAAEGAESPFVQEEQMDIRQEEPLFTDHEYSSEALAQAETVAKESEEPSESIINNHYDTLGEAQEMKIDVQPDSHTELEKTERLEQGSKPFTATLENGQEIRADKPREASEEPKKRPGVQEKRTEQSASSQKGPSVPFNVMMLKRDTHKQQKAEERRGSYVFPNVALLDVPPAQVQDDAAWIEEQRQLLDLTLKNFNVRANVVHVTQGPSVTRFEVHPEPGVKVNKITNLSDDIKLSLSARDIRIEAPIPGKNTIGIEVPNRTSKVVDLRQMIRSSAFRTSKSPLTAALGLDISGNPVVIDLKKMPHGLIAGATGSGKSVCINTILVSLLYKADPSEVKVLLIDPKMVELAPYNKIPHLVSPVITDAKAATAALKWVVEEMERRYELFAHSGVRDIDRFNQLTAEHQMGEKLPYLVVIIDELADLMMVAPNDVEESIARIAQKARACGIHLLVATQRPSVDVITGLIKANIPTRIAFSVSSQVDSRTIIDIAGAEKLLGKGDMLFLENGSGKPVRLQGNFVSDREIDRVVSHVRSQMPPTYLFEQEELVRQGSALKEEDELFYEACEFVVEQNSASTSSLQRRFRIGYNRAARLIDMMEAEGMISEAKGSKPREVLITASDLINE
ncbi:DNA translocase SftA [Bacillus subtilis]|uniref:DNA translocase SftA n=1 Tax=Bacillus subtilis TaxID=1423 RepID=UPI002116B349|nr:DNA translocase SftA [Bacillus subtilis]UUH69429.1 DNA translocase SftA [Bacillus subtilis subsp. subtilis]UUH81450.1 DNA translocase SftA [Bacillus subtilis]UUI47914.1 DNA translocase SftA [Bacillus subtilis]